MRTVFVNPSPKRKRHIKRRKPASRTYHAPKRRVRRRRHNTGIVPFVQNNPLILENPRRSRRRKRRNPSLNLNTLVNDGIGYLGGAAIGTGANILAIRRIENVMMRNALRIGVAVISGMYLPGKFGGAAAGATLYPMFAEIALMLKLVGEETVTPTSADLNELAADLESALDDVTDDEDDELFVS